MGDRLRELSRTASAPRRRLPVDLPTLLEHTPRPAPARGRADTDLRSPGPRRRPGSKTTPPSCDWTGTAPRRPSGTSAPARTRSTSVSRPHNTEAEGRHTIVSDLRAPQPDGSPYLPTPTAPGPSRTRCREMPGNRPPSLRDTSLGLQPCVSGAGTGRLQAHRGRGCARGAAQHTKTPCRGWMELCQRRGCGQRPRGIALAGQRHVIVVVRACGGAPGAGWDRPLSAPPMPE